MEVQHAAVIRATVYAGSKETLPRGRPGSSLTLSWLCILSKYDVVSQAMTLSLAACGKASHESKEELGNKRMHEKRAITAR
jgi:hypothetical protein